MGREHGEEGKDAQESRAAGSDSKRSSHMPAKTAFCTSTLVVDAREAIRIPALKQQKSPAHRLKTTKIWGQSWDFGHPQHGFSIQHTAPPMRNDLWVSRNWETTYGQTEEHMFRIVGSGGYGSAWQAGSAHTSERHNGHTAEVEEYELLVNLLAEEMAQRLALVYSVACSFACSFAVHHCSGRYSPFARR